jgi:hypothetical protein
MTGRKLFPPFFCGAESFVADQEEERHEQPNPYGPYGAWNWLRAAETEVGNVDRGHHAANRYISEDDPDKQVPQAKAIGAKQISVLDSVAVWKKSQIETIANRQDHCKYEGEDAVLSSTATATFIEWIRAKGHGQKGDEEKDDQWDAEEQMLSLRGGDYRRAIQRRGSGQRRG